VTPRVGERAVAYSGAIDAVAGERFGVVGEAPVRLDVEPDWDDLLSRALSGSSVNLHFQPIVDVAQSTVVGYEALARFDAPYELTPDRWFEAARREGVSSQLELAVLHKSLQARHDL